MNPDIRLRCSRILVTGGGSGIGRAIAERLAAAGAQVTIAGRHMEKLRSAAAEIGSDRIHPIVWDIADVDAWQQKAVQIQEMMGGLDGFVNAAALGSAVVTGRGFDPFDITASEWDQLNDVNFKAAFFMLRCSPSMEPKLCSISASSAGEGLVVRAGAREEKYSVWL